MNPKAKAKALSQEEIDRIVIAQADDDSAWGKPIHARRTKQASLSLPSELAARAAFFARLHREPNVGNWLKRIIRERIDMEEAAFAGLKRDLSAKN
jgi:hypothetical protein